MKNKLPDGWMEAKLGDVGDLIMGQSPPGTSYNFDKKGIPLLNGAVDFQDNKIVANQFTTTPTKLSRKGDILFCIRATIGKITLSDKEYCLGRGVAALRVKPKVIDEKFLMKILDKQLKYLVLKGSIIKGVRKEDLVEINIPVPPLKVQQQIVLILEKVERAKELRKEADKLTQDFLKAVFLEMFGDPLRNPKQWEVVKLSKIGELARGKSKHRPRNDPKLLGGKYPLIQTGDVANSKGYITKFTQTYSELGLKQSKMWRKGTLCITIAANIARTGILTFDACFPDSIVGFTPTSHTNIEYIQCWLSFLQKTLEESAPESAQKNINLEILENLNVPLPPITLQHKFAEIVKSIEYTKNYQEHSKEYLENMFNVLMQKSFKGELAC